MAGSSKWGMNLQHNTHVIIRRLRVPQTLQFPRLRVPQITHAWCPAKAAAWASVDWHCDGGTHREGQRDDVFRLNVEIERRWKTWSRRYMGSKGVGGDQERHTWYHLFFSVKEIDMAFFWKVEIALVRRGRSISFCAHPVRSIISLPAVQILSFLRP